MGAVSRRRSAGIMLSHCRRPQMIVTKDIPSDPNAFAAPLVTWSLDYDKDPVQVKKHEAQAEEAQWRDPTEEEWALLEAIGLPAGVEAVAAGVCKTEADGLLYTREALSAD